MRKTGIFAAVTASVLVGILAIAALDQKMTEAAEREEEKAANMRSAIMASRLDGHPFYAELRRTDRDSFSEFDRDKDGRITLEEAIASMEKQFELLDLNKDGFVDYEEVNLAKFVVRMAQNGYRPEKVHSEHPSVAMSRMVAWFPILDVNKDDKFSFEEMRPGIESWFRVYDINGDNAIERTELFFEVPPAWLGALHDSDRRIMERFNVFDGNEEGRSIPEGFNFVILAKARFDEFDRDKNGQITFEEYMLTLREKFDLFDRDKDGFLNYFESYSGGRVVYHRHQPPIRVPGASYVMSFHSSLCSLRTWLVVKRDTPNHYLRSYYLTGNGGGGGGRCSFQDLTTDLEHEFRGWDLDNDGIVVFPEMFQYQYRWSVRGRLK